VSFFSPRDISYNGSKVGNQAGGRGAATPALGPDQSRTKAMNRAGEGKWGPGPV